MKIIVGFGNPEEKFQGTRHNVGFWVLDALARTHSVSFKLENKFSARIAVTIIDGDKILLVRPETYYNDVGMSIRAIIDFYKLSSHDVLLIHDDLALPLGTIRTRQGGSDAGNNGLKSVAAHVGTDTARVRVGVWVESHSTTDNVSIVLGKFTSDERAVLTDELPTITRIVDDFVAGAFTATTHQLLKK